MYVGVDMGLRNIGIVKYDRGNAKVLYENINTGLGIQSTANDLLAFVEQELQYIFPYSATIGIDCSKLVMHNRKGQFANTYMFMGMVLAQNVNSLVYRIEPSAIRKCFGLSSRVKKQEVYDCIPEETMHQVSHCSEHIKDALVIAYVLDKFSTYPILETW